MYFLTREQMRKCEQYAVDSGMSWQRLMENAGSAAAHAIGCNYTLQGRTVAVLCGAGNNGGDGYVIARRLYEAGAKVAVIRAEETPVSVSAIEMAAKVRERNIPVFSYLQSPDACETILNNAEYFIDALYGTGFHGETDENSARLITAVNARRRTVISVDLPSGSECDTGKTAAVCIHASLTIALHSLKPAHALYPAAGICGQIITVGIGLSENADSEFRDQITLISRERVAALLPPRPADSSKGTFGRLLLVAGSLRMTGAAVLAAQGALRTGAGLCELALPECAHPIVAAGLHEPIFLPLPQTPEGSLSPLCLPLLNTSLSCASAVAAGCGLSQGDGVAKVIGFLIKHTKVPLVLDADGINAVAAHMDLLQDFSAPLILTPHPGEMARLCGVSVEEVQSDRFGIAAGFAKKHGVIVVLKGAHTVIALPTGRLFVNFTGNSGMATAGSGDVLAGMIASFLCQGLSPEDACCCGVYLHGAAGDAACKRLGERAMLASDLPDSLPGAFAELYHNA